MPRGRPGSSSQEGAHQAEGSVGPGLGPCAHSDLCGRRWFEVGPSALPVVGYAGLTEQDAFAPCRHLCSALLGGPQIHGWTLPCGPITTA